MNHFMARLIFCFFAEDTDIFVGKGRFTETVAQMSARDSSNTHEVIATLFRAMNTKPEDRAAAKIPRWAEDFPYVNGALFAGSSEVPRFSRIARSYLLHVGGLDWTKINPDIFGSMIQAIAEDEERGELGMHYTSVPNILKVLNPLFLDELRAKLAQAGDNARMLLNLRKRMAKIRVFDPACGSGNFLVIAYKEMRAIEAEINKRRGEPDRASDIPLTNFRGIELRDFPAEIARLALIIAEYQCDVLYRGQKLATVALDGTKIHANASRHSALSHGHTLQLEVQLKAEVQDLLEQAEKADQSDLPDGIDLPDEIKRRQDRLAAMEQAKAKIEARARERFDREQADYQEKLARREARAAQTGRKPGGKPPQPPVAGPCPSDQINLTDEASRIMKVAGGGFEQCDNAQAAVAAQSLLVVATGLTQAGNDMEQVKPMLQTITTLPATLGQVTDLLADTGFCSQGHITACEQAGIEPYIAVAREDHHPGWRERFAEPEPLDAHATPLQKMAHKLKTRTGRKLYALRKQTVEPVFGIIKSVMGFRQFLLRGLEQVKGEWTLACLAWNLKRMAVLRQKSAQCA